MSKAIFTFLLFLTFSLSGYSEELTPIRIGWQTSWATEGQIAVILQKTNILKLNGLKGIFKGFSYGGPLNEGALADAVDVIFTADQPACMLLATGAKWKIIGRLIYNRVGTIVRPDSDIKTPYDLKGKIVAIPFGAAAHRETLKAIKEAGLNPNKDVIIKNLGIYEQVNIVQKGGDWNKIDAFSTWDPPLAEFELTNKAKAIDYGLVTSVIVMSDKFIEKHPQAVVNFLKSYITAFHYYATHQDLANKWFKEKSGLKFDTKVLNKAAEVEPNLKKKNLTDIDILLKEPDIAIIQSGADFIYQQKLTDKHIKVRDYIDQSYLRKAIEEISNLNVDKYLNQIKIIE
jgi:sulfonate transport system substrate-binding protein